MIRRKIPSSGQELPVIGLGTWKTFDTAAASAKQLLAEVIGTMKQAGATLIDTSPMYGNAELVVGELTAGPALHDHFFYATKVWIDGRSAGIRQMRDSLKRLRRDKIDLMQIHNLKDWKTHLNTLNTWKAEGLICYTGITHHADSMHPELERIITTEKVDFLQFNYSVFSRNAEKRLLKVAADRGVATIINRPFGEGAAFKKVKNMELPPWSRDLGIDSWSQFFLLYIVSNPAVTAVIPATGNPLHVLENLRVVESDLPDEHLRMKMAAWADNI